MNMLDFLLHFDTQLPQLFVTYGVWVYAIVFLIVFCETGLVVTPFLPGDSMLFALGAFAAHGSLDVSVLAIGLAIAAIAGDSLNYTLGKFFGHRLLENPRQKFFKKAHYEKAHAFYQKYGGKAIILSRFVPIVRTFAPFVAGVAQMNYKKFFAYNVIGGIVWVAIFLFGGYMLGTLPFIKANFKAVIIGIIVVSILPIAWEIFAAKMKKRATKKSSRALSSSK